MIIKWLQNTAQYILKFTYLHDVYVWDKWGSRKKRLTNKKLSPTIPVHAVQRSVKGYSHSQAIELPREKAQRLVNPFQP